MGKLGSYFLGILTGFAITIAAAFILNKKPSHSEGVSMFKEVGEMQTAKVYRIMQTLDDTHALAIDSDDVFSVLSGKCVYLIGDIDSHFYDDMEISASGNKRFYQVGTYRYMTKEEIWKTVPAVKLLDKK